MLNREIFFEFTDPMISTKLNTLNNNISQPNNLVNEINDLRINDQLQNQLNQNKTKQNKTKRSLKRMFAQIFQMLFETENNI